jgi:hypothetical protein
MDWVRLKVKVKYGMIINPEGPLLIVIWILHEASRKQKKKSLKGEPPMVFTSMGFNKNLLDGF